MSSCWIFGGAPISGRLIDLPDKNSYVIAADSGYASAVRMGFAPDMTVGDFDSLTGEKPAVGQVIAVGAEKDDTDTMLAVKKAIEMGFMDISITGALGGRLDHTIANIQTLEYIRTNGGHGRLVGENDTVEVIGEGSHFYKRTDGMYLSLFSYSDFAVITVSGVKYPLEDHRLDNTFPLGVSNEITAPECAITVSEGKLLVVFSKK